MSKKKRSGAAHASTRPTAASSALPSAVAPAAAVALLSTDRTLECPQHSVVARYQQLAKDVTELPATFDRTLWIHSVVLLALQHALLLDEVRHVRYVLLRVMLIESSAQHASLEQLLLFLWTALWLGRTCIASHTRQFPILASQIEATVLWRIGLAAAGASAHVAYFYFHRSSRLQQQHVLLLLFVFGLDVASVALLYRARARVTWPQVALAVVEAPVLTSVFSTLYSYREQLVYDRVAVALVQVTACGHAAVLLAAKVLAREPSTRVQATQSSQQRGHALVAAMRERLDPDDRSQSHHSSAVELLPAAKQKKKRNASKALADVSEQQQQREPEALANKTPSPAFVSTLTQLLEHTSVQVAALALVQTLLLLTHVVLSWSYLLSWEITSVLMLSSAHVLWTLVQLQQKLAEPLPQRLDSERSAIELASNAS